jgi:hypothetical protein
VKVRKTGKNVSNMGEKFSKDIEIVGKKREMLELKNSPNQKTK